MEEKRKLLSLLGSGMKITDACREIGIARDTYYKWRRSDPDFAAQCDLVLTSNKAARKETREARQPVRVQREGSGDDNDTPEEESTFIPYSGRRASQIAREHAAELRHALGELGKYTESLEPQITAAANLWASAQVMWKDIDKYAALQTTCSREGDERLAVNPIFSAYRGQMEGYTALLRTLGLNFAGKMEVKQKSSRDSFFAALAEDDD